MKHISLGELDVSRIGLGTMAMSGYYLDPDSSDVESIRTIHRALDLGVTHIDTAEVYGPYANEELVGRAIKVRRDEVVLATKFGVEGWMESLAPEVEPFGIHTTIVNPGFFRTELLTKESTTYAAPSRAYLEEQ